MNEMQKPSPQKSKTTGRALDAYLEGVVTRVEGSDCIQEIRPLQHVPVLISAELGKGIPCLTVRVINPFLN
jgi:protein SSD1